MSSENQLTTNEPLPPPDLVYLTMDDPEAMGREPQDGDQRWRFSFLLEDGRRLEIRCGRLARDAFRDMLLQEDADDVTERLLGG